jgi:pimeloyl-ACP methyl ester carboxylesterase
MAATAARRCCPTANTGSAMRVFGTGDRVLVWLHGLLLDATLNRGLARTLAAQGNRVVLLDLLGHGRSDKPRPPPIAWTFTPSRWCASSTDSMSIRRFWGSGPTTSPEYWRMAPPTL